MRRWKVFCNDDLSLKKDALKEEIVHFIHSIEHNNTPKTDIISAIECLKIALKIQN